MIKKSTLLHLRVPFSYFLLPVFLFAAAVSPYPFDFVKGALAFIILHFLVYPASNGYNSYFDKDTGSIGGLRNPPKVDLELYRVALILDLVALIMALSILWLFAIMVLIYGLVSKAYSHPSIRLKKMPVIGWLAAGIFQGYFTFLMTLIGLSGLSISELWIPEVQVPAALSTALLFGSYPMTQVYQHDEDQQRGDKTISLLLGVLGTFHFTAVAFTLSMGGFIWYFITYMDILTGLLFALAMTPVLLFFVTWYLKVRRNTAHANFDRTMQLNALSATMLNFFFLWLLLF